MQPPSKHNSYYSNPDFSEAVPETYEEGIPDDPDDYVASAGYPAAFIIQTET